MNKTLLFFTFLVALSVSFISPLYAGSHEKKADGAMTAETNKKDEEKKGEKVKEDSAEDEEPDCD